MVISTERREYNRKYYLKHCEEQRKKAQVRSAKWREEHPKGFREYYLANREKMLQRAKDYYYTHKEERRIYCQQWRKANRDQIRERFNRWVAENPEKWKTYGHNYRAKARGNVGKLPSDAVIILFNKQGGLCYLCGELLYGKLDDTPSLEHKTPISRGGSNNIENVALAHRSCNSKKGTMTDTEFLAEIL